MHAHMENILSHWAGVGYPQNCSWIYKHNLATGAFKASVPNHNQLPREGIFLSLPLFLSRFWIPPLIFQAFQKSQGHIIIPPSWRNPGLGMSKAFFRDKPRSPSVAPATSNLSLSGLPVYTQWLLERKNDLTQFAYQFCLVCEAKRSLQLINKLPSPNINGTDDNYHLLSVPHVPDAFTNI